MYLKVVHIMRWGAGIKFSIDHAGHDLTLAVPSTHGAFTCITSVYLHLLVPYQLTLVLGTAHIGWPAHHTLSRRPGTPVAAMCAKCRVRGTVCDRE